MGFLNFVLTFALVSLAFINNHLVVALPAFHQNQTDGDVGALRMGKQQSSITLSATSTTFGTPIPPPLPAAAAISDVHSHAHSHPQATQAWTQPSSSSSDQYPPLAYSLVKSYSAGSFFDQFDFYTGSDPTNGFVEFVDQPTAESNNLISESNGVAIIASDSTNIAPGGRQSVRLESKDEFQEVLIIADFAHLPSAACGTWPAFWTTSLNNWPEGGEIDIIEGVNQESTNHVALHTSPGCTVSGGAQTGEFDTTDCDANIEGNTGCGGYSSSSSSYGDGFNELGGGVYAMDWRAEGIRVWSFPRGNIPQDILAGNPTTDGWPLPDFDFTGRDANIPSHFSSHKLIFDLTYDPLLGLRLTGRFCGDWAGSVFNQCGCYGTCEDFVANNPSAFTNSYFAIQNLTVFKGS